MYDLNGANHFLHHTSFGTVNAVPISASPYPPQRPNDVPFTPQFTPTHQIWSAQQSITPSNPLSIQTNHPAVQWVTYNPGQPSPISATRPQHASHNGLVEGHSSTAQGNYHYLFPNCLQHPSHYTLPSSPVVPRPTLPSPAPSDESASHPKRTASVSGPMRQSPSSGASDAGTPVQLNSTPRAWTQPAQAQSSAMLYQMSGPGMVPPPLMQYQPHPPMMSMSHVPAMQPNPPHNTASTAQQGSQRQPQLAPRYTMPLNRTLLVQSLDQIASRYQAQPNKGPGYLTGIGRISLLRNAVEHDDMFYIVLSQLVCLRSANPKALPVLFQKLPQSCFDVLDQLLCSNNDLDPSLLSWLATFPQPLEWFHSDPNIRELSALYDSSIKAVCKFLTLLGPRWQHLRDKCKTEQSPPLIQEMKEQLLLYSPCLHTVIYRAIGRELLLGCSGADRGLSCLEDMHRMDQVMEMKRIVRDKTSLNEAHNAVKLLLTWFRMHEARRMSQPDLHEFRVPTQVMNMFQHLGSVSGGHATTVNNVSLPRIPPESNIPASAEIPRVRHTQGSLFAHTQPRLTQTNRVPGQKDVRFVFPRQGDAPPPVPTEPQTARIGLHQSHLQSPEPELCDLDGKFSNLFRHVSGFGFWPPWRLDPDIIKQVIIFTVSVEDYARTSKVVKSDDPTSIPRRTPDSHSLTWRLRCSRATDPRLVLGESDWLEGDTVWPEDTYFFIGEGLQLLEPRKKLHHGRYLPVDLTSYIQAGTNTLTVVINRNSTNSFKPYKYALAVEKIEVLSHQYILDHIPEIDHDLALTNITNTIQPSPRVSNDDDEIMITSTSVTLNVRNPHTLLLFDVPVRSSRCKHFDCFDLPTYLLAAKRDGPAWPCRPDTWRCPICRCDARPSLLLKDGFFARVRQEVENRAETDADAIIIEADGSWRVKARKQTTGVRSASLEREEAERNKRKERVVIEID